MIKGGDLSVFEEYLESLTKQQIFDLIDKLWEDLGGKDEGVKIIEKWRTGKLRMYFKEVVQPIAVVYPALVGEVVHSVILEPYKADSIADAIKLGKYNSTDGNIAELFAEDEVGLIAPVKVDFFKFDRDPYYQDLLGWATAHGDKKPILPKHIFAIGAQHGELQCKVRIVAVGSVRSDRVLCLDGDLDWRDLLSLSAAQKGWSRSCWFGFISE